MSAQRRAVLAHPAVLTSAGVGGTLAVLSVVRPMPWPFWVAWAVMGAVAIRQAVRDR